MKIVLLCRTHTHMDVESNIRPMDTLTSMTACLISMNSAMMSPNPQSINGQKMTISGTVKILFLIQYNSIIT